LGRLLHRKPLEYEKLREVVSTINSIMNNYLYSANIQVVPTPKNIKIETLIEMAIKKEAPFEEKDKGFRDTIILFTIIEHMLSNKLSNAILVSGDRIFSHEDVANRLKENGLNIIVSNNIKEAKEKLKSIISDVVKIIIDKEKEELKAFLNKRSEEIFKFVLEKAEISEFFLKGGFITSEDIPGSIKKVLSVRPIEISDVNPGLTFSDKQPPQGYEFVTFSVLTEFDLVIQQSGLAALFGPRFPLSSLEVFERLSYEPQKLIETQKTIKRNITVEALIAKKNDQYADLQLLRCVTF